MNQEIMLERIAMLLSRFSEEVKILNFNGEFSINVHAENALIKLLNAVFECELENINYVENKQFPSIDLRDKKKKIAIQVTADESLSKVLDCLNKFLKFNLNNDYDELYIVMLVRKQKSYSQNSIDKARKSFKFSQDNILEIKDLYAMLSAKNDIDTIKTVLKYLEMQFSDQIAYEVWKKYTTDLKEYDKSIVRQFEYVDISGYSPKINALQVKVSLNDLYVHQLLGCNINNQQHSLPISLKMDKLEAQKNLFCYNVVYPIAPISKTIEFRNSITRFINNNELESIPTQYIISYVDDDKEVEKAHQVLESIKAIKNHKLRQKLAEGVLNSVIWKDAEDMERYAEMLKKEFKGVDCRRIDDFIKKEKINEAIESDIKDALHVIEKYRVFSIYYSKESDSLLIISDGNLFRYHIPFISIDELNLPYIEDIGSFAKFLNCIIDFIREEKVVFKSVDDFNLYVKYCDMVT